MDRQIERARAALQTHLGKAHGIVMASEAALAAMDDGRVDEARTALDRTAQYLTEAIIKLGGAIDAIEALQRGEEGR